MHRSTQDDSNKIYFIFSEYSTNLHDHHARCASARGGAPVRRHGGDRIPHHVFTTSIAAARGRRRARLGRWGIIVRVGDIGVAETNLGSGIHQRQGWHDAHRWPVVVPTAPGRKGESEMRLKLEREDTWLSP
jgi:hypothetical protein